MTEPKTSEPAQTTPPQDAQAVGVTRSVPTGYTLRDGVVDKDRRLIVSVACCACEHELKGTLITDVCPECGCSVASTLVWRLMLVDRAWLAKISKAMKFLCVLFFCASGAGLVWGYRLGMLMAGYLATVSFSEPLLNVVVPSLLLGAASSLILAAMLIWRATAPEPRLAESWSSTASSDRVRQLARWVLLPALVFPVLIAGLPLLFQYLGIFDVYQRQSLASILNHGTLFLTLALSACVAGTLGGLGLLTNYLAHLAERINRAGLRFALLFTPWAMVAGLLAAWRYAPFADRYFGYGVADIASNWLFSITLISSSVFISSVTIAITGDALGRILKQHNNAIDLGIFSPRVGDDQSSSLPGEVVFDAICYRCSYNLRGQLVTGLCPECGDPVRWSVVYRRSLIRSDKQWLRRVSGGLTVTAWGLALTLAPVMINLVSAVLFGSNRRSVLSAVVWSDWFSVDLLLHILKHSSCILIFWGAWRATEPEPAREHGKESARLDEPLRKFTRFFLMIFVAPVLHAAGNLLMALDRNYGSYFISELIEDGSRYDNVFPFIAAMFLLLAYQRTLSQRLPDSKLQTWLLCVMIAWPMPWLISHVPEPKLRWIWELLRRCGLLFGTDESFRLLSLVCLLITTPFAIAVTALLARHLHRIARSDVKLAETSAPKSAA